MDEKTTPIAAIPLVVDLDGTLIKVDTLQEGFIQLAARQPMQAARALFMLRHGRAKFKAAVAHYVVPDIGTVPLDAAVIEAIQQARKEGRQVYLATAADTQCAGAVAGAIGLFDGIFASGDGNNLKGQAKAQRLVAAFGARGFDYIGNCSADWPVWRAARVALAAGASPRLSEQLNRALPGSVVLSRRESILWPCLWALRPHQWLKNALVALPTLAGHDFSLGIFVAVLMAFTSFSLGASSLYVINDVLDVSHDRAHPEKRYRPIAAGRLPLGYAAFLVVTLALVSVGLALLLPPLFLLVLASYFALSLSYSLYLKRKLMIDVVALAALYGIRVVAGGAATGMVLSHWLVGFCFFIFLSLALMKRTTEMISLPEESVGNIKGRGYRRVDFPVINALTVASGFVAVLVLALYINSPDVKLLYARPDLLWGICVVLTYWLGRAFFLTGRGEMRQDPVVFAATDRISWYAGFLVAVVFLLAI